MSELNQTLAFFISNFARHSQQTHSFEAKTVTLYGFGGETVLVQNLVANHLEGQKVARFPLCVLTSIVRPKMGISCHQAAACNLWSAAKYCSFNALSVKHIFNTPLTRTSPYPAHSLQALFPSTFLNGPTSVNQCSRCWDYLHGFTCPCSDDKAHQNKTQPVP